MNDLRFRVFVGWSGDAGKAVALALHAWIPDVLQGVEPWMSEEDIDKGAQWDGQLATGLGTSSFGIFCITPENLSSLWMPFEAGALGTRLKDEKFICPFLYQVPASATPAPLRQFQVTEATEVDTKRMMLSMNRARGPTAISEAAVGRAFDRMWGDLDAKLGEITVSHQVAPAPPPPPSELLSEILETVRRLARDQEDSSPRTGKHGPGRGLRALLGESRPRSRLAQEALDLGEGSRSRLAPQELSWARADLRTSLEKWAPDEGFVSSAIAQFERNAEAMGLGSNELVHYAEGFEREIRERYFRPDVNS